MRRSSKSAVSQAGGRGLVAGAALIVGCGGGEAGTSGVVGAAVRGNQRARVSARGRGLIGFVR